MADKLTTVAVVVYSPKGRRLRVKVTAQYFRIVDGALIFRNGSLDNGYPVTVHVFAPGHWHEIINLSELPA